MKRIIALVLLLAVFLSMSGCKGSKVQLVEELIFQIGEVTVDSEPAIVKAEVAYNSLSEKDKAKVDNYDILVAARNSIEVVEINIDNVDDYFKVEETVDDFEYTEDYFVTSASAKYTIRISKKADCRVKKVSFNLGLLAWDDNWESYDDLEQVTLSEDGDYEGTFHVKLKNNASVLPWFFGEPKFSILWKDLEGEVIVMKKADG